MSDILPRRLVVLPGAIEREEEEARPTPDEAVGRVLAANVLAPGLLSEARHHVVVARNSVREATQAARSCRDAELAYELTRRRHDPRGGRSLPFWAAAAVLGVLLAVACVIGLALGWPLPWLDRVGLVAGVAVLGGAVAWGASRRRDAAVGFVLAGLGMCLVLVALGVLWTAGAVALRVTEAVAFGMALAAAAVAAVLILERAECWRCCQARRTYLLAARRRHDLLIQVSLDEAAAEAAVGAWVSLVVEECQLAHPGGAGSTSWVEDCADVARKVAVPE